MARFRTSARTVDMLGRQQIAGIPTAISELFKNAHDAYATRVEADFYRPEQLLVLRDDGLGMTLDDILERWLVLGDRQQTRRRDAAINSVASPLGMQRRIPTGEKGIGRLAIAAIGPQVLSGEPSKAARWFAPSGRVLRQLVAVRTSESVAG